MLWLCSIYLYAVHSTVYPPSPAQCSTVLCCFALLRCFVLFALSAHHTLAIGVKDTCSADNLPPTPTDGVLLEQLLFSGMLEAVEVPRAPH